MLDRKAQGDRDHLFVAQEAANGGADIIQLRDKGASAKELLEIGKRIREITQDKGVIFIVNDSPDMAIECNADGVHLGQDDVGVAVARKILGQGKIMLQIKCE